MKPFEITQDARFAAPADTALVVTAFLKKVYGWMSAGLGITAVVAYAVAASPSATAMLVQNKILFFGLIIAELGLVVFLSARVQKMSATTAMGSFVAYSALSGLTLSLILLRYTGTSVATTFVVTAGAFGALALFGTVTKRSLAGLGQFAFMGLVGVVLASIVGMFMSSPGLEFGISVIGVIVFTCLTAWDAQRLKTMAVQIPAGRETSYAVVGALSLYLDFINLFLFLLRFMGRRD